MAIAAPAHGQPAPHSYLPSLLSLTNLTAPTLGSPRRQHPPFSKAPGSGEQRSRQRQGKALTTSPCSTHWPCCLTCRPTQSTMLVEAQHRPGGEVGGGTGNNKHEVSSRTVRQTQQPRKSHRPHFASTAAIGAGWPLTLRRDWWCSSGVHVS